MSLFFFNSLKDEARVKSHEKFLLCFVFVYCLLLSGSGLNFSRELLDTFYLYVIFLLLVTYLSSIFVILIKGYSRWKLEGKFPLSFEENTKSIFYPYFTLAFFSRNLRRGVSLFATIYLFLHLKHIILNINHSNYDLLFWQLDRVIHFGLQPNVFLMQVIGESQEIAVFLDWLYFKYFFIKVIVFVFFMLELKSNKLSERFYCAMVMMWGLGGLLYLVTPADGPCYSVLYHYSVRPQDRVHVFEYPVVKNGVPDDFFEKYQNSKIRTAKGYQKKLWNVRANFIYKNKEPNMFYGIAAMPSMHVAVIAIFCLFMFLVSGYLALLMLVVFALIFIGSVFLQWHYAVDGYFGVLLALFVYKVTGISSVKLNRGDLLP